MPDHFAALAIAIALVAALYASVGQAGASGYIAVLSLFSVAPAAIKPTALVLNTFVATIGAVQFWRAGYVSWRRVWPFAIASVPLASIGGYVHLPAAAFNALLGTLLLVGAVLLLRRRPAPARSPHPAAAIAVGGVVGLLSGLTGIGGGIVITPVLLLMGWSDMRSAAGVSIMFILANSLAALAGYLASNHALPSATAPLLVAALIGGGVGSFLGGRKLPHTAIERVLIALLIVAGVKLLMDL